MDAQEVPDRLEIDDPRALRALAHEARLRVVTELYSGAALTATEAARLAGVTPSAMSYHLRALAKWGIVVPSESTDGRERPWRAAARSLSLAPGSPQGMEPAVASAVVATYVKDLQNAVLAAIDAPWGPQGERGRSHAMTRTRARLTLTQARALAREVEELLDRYVDLEPGPDADARTWELFWVAVPQAQGGGSTGGRSAQGDE